MRVLKRKKDPEHFLMTVAAVRTNRICNKIVTVDLILSWCVKLHYMLLVVKEIENEVHTQQHAFVFFRA